MRNKTKIFFATGLLTTQLLILPSLVLAVDTPPVDPSPTTNTTLPPCIEGQNGVACPKDLGPNAGPDYIVALINTVANWMFTILLITAVCFIVWAAYNYLTGTGEAEKVTAAHRALLYAAVAIVVAMLSRGFVYIIRNTVAGTNTPGTYYAGGTQGTNDPTGGNGGTGGTSGTGTGGTGTVTAPSNSFSYISSFSEFTVQIQICSDGKTPGIKITNEEGVTYINQGTDGNPDIGYDSAAGPSTGNMQNAGQFVPLGSMFTGTWPFRTEYKVQAETCNDGQTPRVRYNQGSNTSNFQYL